MVVSARSFGLSQCPSTGRPPLNTHRVLAAAAFLLFAGVSAHASTSDCEEFKQAAIREQRDRCIAHVPCNFVLDRKLECATAVSFLKRLQANAPDPRSAISANDVYEANLPEVEFSQDWKDRFAAIREKVVASGAETQSGRLGDGSAWVYQGDVQDGKRHGWGVFIWHSGSMHRGQFVQDWRTGRGEFAAPNGYRDVGAYENNNLHGEGWARLREGAQRKGNFSKGKLNGAGSYRFPNGNLYTGNFIDDNFNGAGKYLWADGSSFEGNFTNDKFDGRGTFTSASGVQSTRTYAAGTLVASQGASPAAAANPTAACTSSFNSCAALCTAGGVLGVLLGRRDTAASQRCLEDCSSTQRQCLAGTGASGGVASGGTLRWPSEGGIEQWTGHSRPGVCAPDLFYLQPLYAAVNAKLGMTIAFSETRNFYTSPTVVSFTKNPQALSLMQKDLDNFAKIATDAREVAGSVVKLSSRGETAAGIVDQIRGLQFDSLQCGNTSSGMRAQHYCGAAIKLLELTHRVEGMIQMACRMNVATPSYPRGG